MVLNRVSDVSAELIDDVKQVKSYLNFSHVEMWFFSVVKIPIKHSSLHNRRIPQAPIGLFLQPMRRQR